MPESLDITAFEVALMGVTFLAALLQSATGFGFGMIVGPMLLAYLSVPDAIQSTGILTFTIVLILAPFLFRHCNGKVFTFLAVWITIEHRLARTTEWLVAISLIRTLQLIVLQNSFRFGLEKLDQSSFCCHVVPSFSCLSCGSL